MMKIILASKSKVRKDILTEHNIDCEVIQSNVDEDPIKDSLIAEGATPEIISKNLAELKANKVSSNVYDKLVLGADSVIDLEGELISKPKSRDEAIKILKKLNGKVHYLISSVCISKNGAMIWNHSDSSELKMKNLTEKQIKNYLGNYDAIIQWPSSKIIPGVTGWLLDTLNINNFTDSTNLNIRIIGKKKKIY